MKRIGLALSVARLAVAALTTLPSTGTAQGSSDEHSKIRAGYALIEQAGIQVNLKGKNPSLVGLGSYIVNAQADCNGCHGNPTYADGGDPHLGQPEVTDLNGYLIGGAPLFGPFLPRNLTPNAAGRPAGLTLERFVETMRTGKDLKFRAPHVPSDQNDLLQVMPWPVFKNMSDRELAAIYEFLSTLPCKDPTATGRCN
jgi:hypothetical protein